MLSLAEVLVSLLSALTCSTISTAQPHPLGIRTMLSLSLARPSSHLPLPSFWFFSCFCFSSSASFARPSVSGRRLAVVWESNVLMADGRTQLGLLAGAAGYRLREGSALDRGNGHERCAAGNAACGVHLGCCSWVCGVGGLGVATEAPIEKSDGIERF